VTTFYDINADSAARLQTNESDGGSLSDKYTGEWRVTTMTCRQWRRCESSMCRIVMHTD